MSEYFAATPVTNATLVCVGSITHSEAAAARDSGLDIDGMGYYLFLAREDAPSQPIEILAKFFSPGEAERLMRLIGPSN